MCHCLKWQRVTEAPLKASKFMLLSILQVFKSTEAPMMKDLRASYFQRSHPKSLLKLEFGILIDSDAFEKFCLDIPHRLYTLWAQCNIFLSSLRYLCPISAERDYKL